MPRHRLGTRFLQPNAQVAEELGMPVIRVGSQQFIRLLEGKEIEHQFPQLTPLVDVVVQDPRVGRRQHAIRLVGEIGHHVHDVVPEGLEAEAVGEDVEMEEGVVCGFSVLERRGDGRGVEPCDEEFEGGDVDAVETQRLSGGFEERACEGGAEIGRLLGQ